MIVDRRRVDRLSLQVERAADVPTAADTIRQALRIATMPGDGRPGRLFIRRIDLGAIRIGDPPSRIARSMETYLRTLRRNAVPIADPRAAAADVVIARDPIEPLVVALAHAAAGRRLSAWYWPHVHEQLTARRSPAEIAMIVWTLLAHRSDAAACIPAVVGAVLDRDRAVEMLAAIDPILGERLFRVLEVTPIAGTLAAVAGNTIEPRWRSAVLAAIEMWSGDTRAVWLVTAAVRAANPRISAARLAAVLRGVTAVPVHDTGRGRPPHAPSLSQPSPRPTEKTSIPTPEQLDEPSRSSAAVVETLSRNLPPTLAPSDVVPPVPAPAASPSAPTQRSAPPSEPTPDELPPSPEPDRNPPTRWTLIERPQLTGHGGLYFLLRPLARLKLEAFVAAHPELEAVDFGIRLLDRIADALGIPPDDPIRVALDLPKLESPPEQFDELIEAWHAAVSAWVEHHAKLDLATVVGRDAAVLCSRTHLDVIFDMQATDVRIRKAALDIDPGFVRWLGRVVQFHYVHGGMLDA